MNEPRCSRCKYAEKEKSSDYICHRFPPQIIYAERRVHQVQSRFPEVMAFSWCGEFIKKEENNSYYYNDEDDDSSYYNDW